MKIGIDLGTCNSVVFIPNKGVVLQEPSVVAIALVENEIMAVGRRAKEMMGRTPDNIKIYRPLKDGVIADFRVTQAMLKYFLDKTIGRFRFFKPELMIGVPAGVTSTERRAVVEAGLNSGAREVYLAKEPIMAAIGAGIPINSCSGNMVVDIGGGTTETAVISLGGIVNFHSIRVAGDKMDLAISDFIKKKYNLAIGEQIMGLPKNITISSNDVCEAISDILKEIVQAVKSVLRDTPPELSADIINKGMILTGGGALLRNLPQLIEKLVGVPAVTAEEAVLCVAKGTGSMMANLDMYKKSIMAKK